MAQKRNPISLRLQTRLKGYEKRFASCWFTDLFFPQRYADDLVKRLYLGHLLQKGGGWSSEKNESHIPETCISIQFLYRKCCILSVTLDKRKEEYFLSSSIKGARPRREAVSIPFKAKSLSSDSHNKQNAALFTICKTNKVERGDLSLHLNQEGGLVSHAKVKDQYKTQPDNVFKCKQGSFSDLSQNIDPNVFPETIKDNVLEEGGAAYLSMANLFGTISALHFRSRPHLSPIRHLNSTRNIAVAADKNEKNCQNATQDKVLSLKARNKEDEMPIDISKQAPEICYFLAPSQSKNTDFPHSFGRLVSQNKWKDWLRYKTFSQHNVIVDHLSLSLIETLCAYVPAQNISGKDNKKHTHGSQGLTDFISIHKNAIQTEMLACHLKQVSLKQQEAALSMEQVPFTANRITNKETTAPLMVASNWTSLTFIKSTSTCQNVEFCLRSVIFLYEKRLSFLQIKETLFKMLENHGGVRGARLVCSGRQGGRSKSAMRAKSQSALWGRTALSLFSSRLAFASASVDTAFGQIGVKLWICYT